MSNIETTQLETVRRRRCANHASTRTTQLYDRRSDEATLDELEANGQVVLRYAPEENFNGSLRNIAGVRNVAGNVFGLMPHPEHAVDPLTGSTNGLCIFESMRLAVEGVHA